MAMAFALPLTCYGWGEMSKAEDHMIAENYNDAISSLKKVIANNPSNHKAYFMFGEAYIKLGQYEKASKQFKSANNHYKGKYKTKIAESFKQECNTVVAQSNTSKIKILHGIIVGWNKSLVSQVERDVFARTQALLGNGKAKQAQENFDLLVELNSSYGDKISDLYYARGEYKVAAKYSSRNNAKIFANYKAKMEAAETEKEYNEWRSLALEYGNLPPDYKVYGPGDDPGFRLREGTDTDHYIRFTEEVHYDFYSGVNEDQYELLPRNEKPIRVWAGDKIPNNLREFKIRAKKNVIVEIGIKPYSATLAMAR